MSEEVIFSLKITPDEEFKRLLENMNKGGTKRDERGITEETINRLKSAFEQSIQRLDENISGIGSNLNSIYDAVDEINGKIDSINFPGRDDFSLVDYFTHYIENFQDSLNRTIMNMETSGIATATQNAIIRRYGEAFGTMNLSEIISTALTGAILRATEHGDIRTLRRMYDMIGRIEHGQFGIKEFDRLVRLWLGTEHEMLSRTVLGETHEQVTRATPQGAIGINMASVIADYLRALGRSDRNLEHAVGFVMPNITENEMTERITLSENAKRRVVELIRQVIESGNIPQAQDIRRIIFGGENIENLEDIIQNGLRGAYIENMIKLPRFIAEAIYGGEDLQFELARPDIMIILNDVLRQQLERALRENNVEGLRNILSQAVGGDVTEEFARSMVEYLSNNAAARNLFLETGIYMEESKYDMMNKEKIQTEAELIAGGMSSLKRPTAQSNERPIRQIYVPKERLGSQSRIRVILNALEAIRQILIEDMRNEESGEGEGEEAVNPRRLR